MELIQGFLKRERDSWARRNNQIDNGRKFLSKRKFKFSISSLTEFKTGLISKEVDKEFSERDKEKVL